ncbi:hypothetical protein ANN_28056 [Periplaneta americana]|uniref:Uncharacterized protein n=1 Tax=Periplaneta americana TaxID=6978 RepID=A0ABQ8RUR4_PERAM|nr:hypothetical protein ANN_28056 [Periplaneta americana]
MAHEQLNADFTRKFMKPSSSRQVIRDLVKTLKRNGSVADEKHSKRLATTPETVQTIQDAITLSPTASAWSLKLHKPVYGVL